METSRAWVSDQLPAREAGTHPDREIDSEGEGAEVGCRKRKTFFRQEMLDLVDWANQDAETVDGLVLCPRKLANENSPKHNKNRAQANNKLSESPQNAVNQRVRT